MIPKFWTLLWSNKWNVLLDIDVPLSLGAAAAMWIWFPVNDVDRYRLVLTAEASTAVALLGLVVGALSLVVALMNDEYLIAASSVGRGILEDYFPFSWAALLAATTGVVTVGFIALTPENCSDVVRWGISISSGLFVWTLSAALAVVNFVAGTGETRATIARNNRNEQPPQD